MVCRNPRLATERARKRQDLLAATETDLRKVVRAVSRKRNPPRGAVQIGLAAGAMRDRHKVAKHFTLTDLRHLRGLYTSRKTTSWFPRRRMSSCQVFAPAGSARRLARRTGSPISPSSGSFSFNGSPAK